VPKPGPGVSGPDGFSNMLEKLVLPVFRTYMQKQEDAPPLGRRIPEGCLIAHILFFNASLCWICQEYLANG